MRQIIGQINKTNSFRLGCVWPVPICSRRPGDCRRLHSLPNCRPPCCFCLLQLAEANGCNKFRSLAVLDALRQMKLDVCDRCPRKNFFSFLESTSSLMRCSRNALNCFWGDSRSSPFRSGERERESQGIRFQAILAGALRNLKLIPERKRDWILGEST